MDGDPKCPNFSSLLDDITNHLLGVDLVTKVVLGVGADLAKTQSFASCGSRSNAFLHSYSTDSKRLNQNEAEIEQMLASEASSRVFIEERLASMSASRVVLSDLGLSAPVKGLAAVGHMGLFLNPLLNCADFGPTFLNLLLAWEVVKKSKKINLWQL